VSKIKRITAHILTAAVLLTLGGCKRNDGEGAGKIPEPSEASNVTEKASETQSAASPYDDGIIIIPEMNPPMPPPEYPVIDGSSSTIIMHAAIRAYLTDAYFIDDHSQTYAALERLIPGNDNPADVLLSVKYYDDTLRDARRRGADLVITPVAKEGFVFIVHADNPVDSLTQQQLKDIYSGKITNWKDVGGLDEEIVPYTRNWDSGSQTAMEDFMGGVPIVGKEDTIIGGMMTLLTQVQLTGSPGIGYNIYSWSSAQYFGNMGLKTVAVDGVTPTNETLSDGRYSLMVYTYSYYNRSNEKGKALTDWLLTAEGQRVIAGAGYVGIFGDYSIEAPTNFYKDDSDTAQFAYDYYTDKAKWTSGDEELFHYVFSYSRRIADAEQTKALSKGKGKAVTILLLVHFTDSLAKDEEYLRFIVLTREKGGTFEVINEGEVLSFENGVITPGDNENHRPPT
jgi:hypothetical protein